MKKKKLLIFGATGKTGRELVKQALAKAYTVKAFVRSPGKMNVSDKHLALIQGDVLDYEAVYNAMDAEDIVCCCLGLPASDRSTLRAEGTVNIIKAMEAKKGKRFICQTSLGFGDSQEILPWHMKYLIVPLVLKNAFKDHELQEEVIEKSNLNWTIVRPGNMTNGTKTGMYKHGFKYNEKVKLKISRADVAHIMLQQIEDDQYLNKKVGLSY